ncbi:MAG: bifunctional riboflavin kinase/FAD synthetase [Alphaproteobacteria bacterium]|nr:MAG: bifunctional riboflavin kinase/FAD synthetase [Alphaproteobacteria bacterium]
MRIVKDWKHLDADDRGAAVALGNFDGIHLGHQSVIDAARRKAHEAGRPLGVVTFEPHPREYFAPDAPPFRLMNAEARANRLARMRVDVVYELPFGPEIAGMSPEAFAEEVLSRGLGVSHVVVGQDFRFGKDRAGDAELLAEMGGRLGFGVTRAPLVQLEPGEVSSTAIRKALVAGRPRDAARMLGHFHRIDGVVEHGEKRGRKLGFPTANLPLQGLLLPALGVYAVRADVLSGPHKGGYEGVASIGTRPMFGVHAPNLETHLFDFDGDLYGEHLSVALVDYLRPEAVFDNVEGLVRQMREDAAEARARLRAEA